MKKSGLTNSEKRTQIYTSDQPPTVPSTVTSETPLVDLNLSWKEVDLPERERTKHVHRLHPYLGKYIPQLVEVFLRKYFPVGSIVLDPFCGSATTLVQANELGIHSIGYDISGFNVLLGKVKLGTYDLKILEADIFDALTKFEEKVNQQAFTQKSLWERARTYPDQRENEYLQKWFSPEVLAQLLTYRQIIEENQYSYPETLKIILSRSARSSRLTTHFDLDFPKQPTSEPYYCYKHTRICQPTTEAKKFLRRYSIDTFKRIGEFSRLRTTASVSIHHADARSVQFPRVDGVITSPPYVGLIDYHAQHEYAYHLLSLDDQSQLEIGAAANGSGQNAKAIYQEAITSVFANCLQAMPHGGVLIIVANDKSNLYPKIGANLGIHEDAIIHRHVNRRTGRRSGEYYESIFIWRKA